MIEYTPLEFVDDSWSTLQTNPAKEAVRKPRQRRKKPALVPPAASFDTFGGLEIRLALVRPPDYAGKPTRIGSSHDVYKLIQPRLEAEYVENFLSLVLDAQHSCIGVFVVSRGQVAAVEVVPADVFRPVLAAGGVACIVAHNHPSGDPEPSRDDQTLTKRLTAAADVLGLPLLDHIIVGSGRYSSFADRGLL